ncbi:MAG TPA: hypothetical protein H9985_03915 [Candidatus Anaerofilum faecale]|nr:hypothetical protein [Candidatus Anaerofilum faecale]
MNGLSPEKRLLEMNDKPLEMMSDQERDNYWIKRTGEPYRDPSQQEIDAVLEKFGLK